MTPTNEAVAEQLTRILASPQFAGAKRLSRFLRFVVERTCAGEGRQLKEYVIGTAVFDRDGKFDPRLDSVVRVEAGRLRTRLREYYLDRGAEDAVVISLPTGQYVPVFELRKRAVAPSRRRLAAWIGAAVVVLSVGVTSVSSLGLFNRRSTDHLSIVVVPFGSSQLVMNVAGDLSRELVRLGRIQVVSHTRVADALARGQAPALIAMQFGADVVVELGATRSGDEIAVEATLVDAAAARKFWVDDFVGEAAKLSELTGKVAAATSVAVARNSQGSYWAQ